MTEQSLIPFFDPKGVAVIGVSRDPTKLGYGLARNLVQSGYQGAVHFVNPKGDRLLGAPIYPSVLNVPDPVDLAVLLVPPPFVPGVLKECSQRGIHAAIIATGGFRETGPEGAALEVQCLEIARAHGIRLIGPNCIGLMDTHLPLDTTFLQPPMPPAGEIAFISHSGAICAAVIDWIRGQGMIRHVGGHEAGPVVLVAILYLVDPAAGDIGLKDKVVPFEEAIACPKITCARR